MCQFSLRCAQCDGDSPQLRGQYRQSEIQELRFTSDGIGRGTGGVYNVVQDGGHNPAAKTRSPDFSFGSYLGLRESEYGNSEWHRRSFFSGAGPGLS